MTACHHLVREAESHADEDRRRREDIEARNQADNLVYQTEKILQESGDRLPADLKSEAEGRVAAVRSAMQSSDAAGIRRAMDDLNQTLQRLGQAVYSGVGSAPGGTPPGGPGGAPSGTVEGEFREV